MFPNNQAGAVPQHAAVQQCRLVMLRWSSKSSSLLIPPSVPPPISAWLCAESLNSGCSYVSPLFHLVLFEMERACVCRQMRDLDALPLSKSLRMADLIPDDILKTRKKNAHGADVVKWWRIIFLSRSDAANFLTFFHLWVLFFSFSRLSSQRNLLLVWLLELCSSKGGT